MLTWQSLLQLDDHHYEEFWLNDWPCYLHIEIWHHSEKQNYTKNYIHVNKIYMTIVINLLFITLMFDIHTDNITFKWR